MRSTNDFDHPEWFEEGDLVAVPVFGQQGKVKLVMRYNVTDDKFVYGGDCTLKFDIKDAKTVKL